MKPTPIYECDKCGACCKVLLVEADWLDGQREPRLYDLAGPNTTEEDLRSGEHCLFLWDPDTRACPYLDGETHHCGIYPTRPNCCVAVQAGDAKCQQARRLQGLEFLRDVNGNEPTREHLEESCERYDLDIDDLMEIIE